MSNGSKRRRKAGPGSATILVVDDQADNVTLLTDLLEHFYLVRVAINGENALRIAGSDNPPDLILLDVMMPDIDGFEVCRRLKARDDTRDIPVIFVTALGSDEGEAHGIELGAVDYVSKPINPQVLLARVRTHLALREAQREVERVNAALVREREVVEDIVGRMHLTAPFDSRGIRRYATSVDMVSGDISCSAYRPDGVQHVLLGDFSGHGLPAAVAGPLASYVFYRMTESGAELASTLDELNRTLHRQLPSQIYMAGCAMALSADRTRAEIWNFGMPAVQVLRGGKVLHQIASSSLPLGVVDSEDFTPDVTAVELTADACIYAFTDGLNEATSPTGEEFGHERMAAQLSKINLTREPLENLWRDIRQFHGSDQFQDDATLLEISAREINSDGA